MTTTGPELAGLVFVRHLGEGGYSDVYLYERRSPRMKVAVKVLKEGRLTDQEQRQFAAEAETMAELADHPNIVQVFSAETTPDGRPYLMMKFYPKPNLGERSARERFSVAETLRTGIKIAGAVETAHRVGIVHRDIKPANILVSQFDEPGLTDFGIAGHAADIDESDDIGLSVPWSPPEVLSGESNGSARSDVYSLAATLWHLLVGRSPFEIPGGDNSPHGLSQRVLRTPPPKTGRGDVPAALERLLSQGMAKNPAARPRSAFEFAQALQSVEQELRFAATDILVGGDAPAAEPRRTDTETGDSTRLRAPTRVDAQPVRRTPSGPSSFAPRTTTPPIDTPPPDRPRTTDEPATRARPAVVAGQPAAAPPERKRAASPSAANPSTVRRAVRPEIDSDDEPVARRRGIRPRTAAFVAAGVVAVAVVLGVVLGSGGGDDRNDRALPTSRATDQTDAPAPVPVVTTSYTAATKALVFSWKVPGATSDDRYVWANVTDDLSASRPTTETSTTITTADPTTTCINVAYVHAGDESVPTRKCGSAG